MPIRKVKPEDAPALLAIYAPYVRDTAVSFEWAVPDEAKFADRIRHTAAELPYLVAEEDGRVVGYCYASRFRTRKSYEQSAEASIYVDSTCHGRGIGRALYTALEAELRERGFRNLYACVAFPRGEDPYLTRNSYEFHRAMGFAECGRFSGCAHKFGRLYDMVYMEKILADR